MALATKTEDQPKRMPRSDCGYHGRDEELAVGPAEGCHCGVTQITAAKHMSKQ
jgi:hypothetical protein